MARAYAIACRAQHIPVSLPDDCVHCPTVGHKIGERHEVHAPQKQADIVVVVDTSSEHLADVVQPVLVQLRQELRARDISDVQIAVIGYNAQREHIRVFAAAGGKLNHSDKTKMAETSTLDKVAEPLRTGNAAVDQLLTKLDKAS